MNTFDREAFGRRSFSEKRKASNGKNKEVVAKVKALREEMKLELETTNNNTEPGRSSALNLVSDGYPAVRCYYFKSWLY